MKVLLLGATGNVGSRLLPALIAHKHQVVVYVRTPSKLSAEASSKADAVVTGSGTDVAAIKAAIMSHNCDAVINSAGLGAMTSWHKKSELPDIFAAVAKAAVEAKKERGGPPLRCWFLSGWSLLDAPTKPYMIVNYVPVYPEHLTNFKLIKTYSGEDIAWSLFCANAMSPVDDPPKFITPAEVAPNPLVAKVDSPPGLKDTFLNWPLIGGYLNLFSQAAGYATKLEYCADFMAADLEKGLKSEYVGKRVGVIEKDKAS